MGWSWRPFRPNGIVVSIWSERALAARSHLFLAKRGNLRGLLTVQGLTIEIPYSVLPGDHPNREILALKQIWVERDTEAFLKVYGNRDGEIPGHFKANTAAEIGRGDKAALKVDPGLKSNV